MHHHRPHSDRFGLSEDIFGMRAALPVPVALTDAYAKSLTAPYTPPVSVVKPIISVPVVPAINYALMVDTLRAEVVRLNNELKRVNILVFESSKLSAELTAAKAGLTSDNTLLTSTNSELTAANAALTSANAVLQTDLQTCREELAATKALLAEVTLNYQNGLVRISELEASNLLSASNSTAAYDELNATLTAQITALQAELEASKLLAADTVAQMAAAEVAHAAKIKELTTSKKSIAAPLALAAVAAYFAFNS